MAYLADFTESGFVPERVFLRLRVIVGIMARRALHQTVGVDPNLTFRIDRWPAQMTRRDHRILCERDRNRVGTRQISTNIRLAYDPDPEDGEENVIETKVLTWTSGHYTQISDAHEIYFGESYTAVRDAGKLDTEYQLAKGGGCICVFKATVPHYRGARSRIVYVSDPDIKSDSSSFDRIGSACSACSSQRRVSWTMSRPAAAAFAWRSIS